MIFMTSNEYVYVHYKVVKYKWCWLSSTHERPGSGGVGWGSQWINIYNQVSSAGLILSVRWFSLKVEFHILICGCIVLSRKQFEILNTLFETICMSMRAGCQRENELKNVFFVQFLTHFALEAATFIKIFIFVINPSRRNTWSAEANEI